MIVPAAVSEEDLLTGNYLDPFADVTYAVFRLKVAEASLSL